MSLEAIMGTLEKTTAEEKSKKPLLLILLKRAAILFFLVNSLSLFFWIVGSYSSFLDETQTALLGTLRISSLLLLFDAAVGAAATVGYSIAARRGPRLLALVGYAGGMAMGAAGLLLSDALLLLGKGLS
jgi:hypothetical protein